MFLQAYLIRISCSTGSRFPFPSSTSTFSQRSTQSSDFLEHLGDTVMRSRRWAEVSWSWNDQVMQEPPAESMHILFISTASSVGESSPIEPGTWARCVGTLCLPLWYQLLDFQVIAKANHPKMSYPKPKGGKTRRVFQKVEKLSSGGSSAGYWLGTRAVMPDALLWRAVLCRVIGKLFILSGLGLSGPGYQVDKKLEISQGREPGHAL